MKLATAAALAILLAAPPSTSAFVPSTKAFVNKRSSFSLSSSIEKDQVIKTPDVANGVIPPDLFERFGKVRKAEGTTAAEARQAANEYLSQYMGQSGAAAVYSKLLENGVKVVNGYSGGAVLPLLDQFHVDNPRHGGAEEPPIRWITNSNEASAGHVAEGYAKSCPIEDDQLPVAVCVATSGPGVTNLITPLQDAMCDGVPVIALCGQAATVAPKDAFQCAPAVDLCAPCTKWSYQIRSAAEVPFVMDYAFFTARNGRPGPVFIDLPKDLQNQIITKELIESFVENDLKNDPSKDHSFAKLVQRQRYDGTAFQALRFGNQDRGLAFEVEKEGDKLTLLPVESASSDDLNHADHHPSSKIYGYRDEKEEQGYLQTDNGLFKQLQDVIVQAKKPIIIAGQGCNNCPEDLKAFAEKLQVPVTTTLHALGVFDERHDLACNMMGMHGHATPNFLVQESDLIICIGSRFDDRITGRMPDFAPEARRAAIEKRGGIIHVDIRLTEKQKQLDPTFFIHSTGKKFLQTMNQSLEKMDVSPRTKDWLKHKSKLQKDFPVPIVRYPTKMITVKNDKGEEITIPATKLNAQSVVQELNRILVEKDLINDSLFTTGVGIHQMVAAQLITWTRPRQMLSSGSLGTMGVAMGYSIGAKLANGKMIVIAVDGDGSFNMTFTELKTIAEQKIPVKLLILDNESQMMVEYWQRLFHDKRLLAVRNSQNPNYGKLADAFGIKNLYCDREEDLEQVLNEFIFSNPDEPILCHVRIERTPCLPMVAPGQPLEDMILEDVDFEVDGSAAPS